MEGEGGKDWTPRCISHSSCSEDGGGWRRMTQSLSIMEDTALGKLAPPPTPHTTCPLNCLQNTALHPPPLSPILISRKVEFPTHNMCWRRHSLRYRAL